MLELETYQIITLKLSKHDKQCRNEPHLNPDENICYRILRILEMYDLIRARATVFNADVANAARTVIRDVCNQFYQLPIAKFGSGSSWLAKFLTAIVTKAHTASRSSCFQYSFQSENCYTPTGSRNSIHSLPHSMISIHSLNQRASAPGP